MARDVKTFTSFEFLSSLPYAITALVVANTLWFEDSKICNEQASTAQIASICAMVAVPMPFDLRTDDRAHGVGERTFLNSPRQNRQKDHMLGTTAAKVWPLVAERCFKDG